MSFTHLSTTFSVIYGALKFSVDKIVPQKAISSSLVKVNVEPVLSTIACRFSSFANKAGLFSQGQNWNVSENTSSRKRLNSLSLK